METEEIEHFSHQHPLISYQYNNDGAGHPQDDRKCYGCSKPLLHEHDSIIYACKHDETTTTTTSCSSFYLHKSCAELPQQLKHPYHPRHPLALTLSWRQRCCTFCHSPILGFTLSCDACDFYLDAHCATHHSTIHYQDAGHHFFLRKSEPKTIFHCDECNGIGRDTHLFQCVIPSCPRFFHFHCSPFPVPKTIKSKYHFHPITYVSAYREDDSGEYYCDACEKERNVNLPVYRCMQCDYHAHVSCIVMEILPSLLREYEKEAKLREDLNRDAGLQRINGKIRRARYQEERLVKELNKVTSKLEALKATRANYISSSSSRSTAIMDGVSPVSSASASSTSTTSAA